MTFKLLELGEKGTLTTMIGAHDLDIQLIKMTKTGRKDELGGGVSGLISGDHYFRFYNSYLWYPLD